MYHYLFQILTADGWLICSIGAVPLSVAHFVQINAQLFSGTLPLVRWTAKWRSGAVLFITHVQAVIVTIALPACWDAQLIGTLEIVGFAGDRGARVVLIWSILTVRMAVTLPLVWYAETIILALKLIIMAEAWTSSGWRGRRNWNKTPTLMTYSYKFQ